MPSTRTIRGRLTAALEGIGWLFLYWLAQGITMLVLIISLIYVGYGTQWPALPDLIDFLNQINDQESFLLIGASTLGSLLIIVPAVWLRLGRTARQYLELVPLRRDHLVFTLAMIIPLAVLGDAFYQVAQNWWVSIISGTEVGRLFAESSIEQLHKAFTGVPYLILVVAVALGPAVGEELVFRGVIGKRMVSAWGVPLGVLFTSILFGIAHFSPAHAIATIPIAICAHLLYLHCRTLWAPIILHFGNNLLAVSAVKFSMSTAITVTPELVCGALVYLGLLAFAWHMNERQLDLARLQAPMTSVHPR